MKEQKAGELGNYFGNLNIAALYQSKDAMLFLFYLFYIEKKNFNEGRC